VTDKRWSWAARALLYVWWTQHLRCTRDEVVVEELMEGDVQLDDEQEAAVTIAFVDGTHRNADTPRRRRTVRQQQRSVALSVVKQLWRVQWALLVNVLMWAEVAPTEGEDSERKKQQLQALYGVDDSEEKFEIAAESGAWVGKWEALGEG